MKLLASSLWTSLVTVTALALAACSGASNGLGNSGGNQTCETTPCGAGGATIQTCTGQATGGCSQITYNVGSQSFTCNSCQGCQNAAQQAASACLNEPGDASTSDGGDANCSAAVPCGAGGRTYQECTTLGAGGTCVSIDYKTSDGRNFSCPGCQSCGTVAQNLQTYCAEPPGDGGSGNTSCSTAVSCGNTGTTYQECTTTGAGGVCKSIQYKVSNGVTYTCSSCSSCTTALQSLDSYCAGSGNPTTACTGANTCASGSTLTYQQCTTSLNGTCEDIYYMTSDGQTFTCNSCSDCSSALSSMTSYCTSQVTPVTNCGSYAACGTGGVEYQLCTTTTGGACTSEYYSTTSGNTYTCTGCDCTTASQNLSTYCASLGTVTCNGTTCAAGDLCCTCAGPTYECLSSNGGSSTCGTYGCQ